MSSDVYQLHTITHAVQFNDTVC